MRAVEKRAREDGLTIVDTVVRAVRAYISLPGKRRVAPANGTARTTPLAFFDRLQEHLKEVPSEGWENIPRDGSLDPDRFVYGRR
jgi:hypothetical protein